MKKSLIALAVITATATTVNADDLFGGPGLFDTADSGSDREILWEGDGSMTIVDGAESSGYIVRDGEVETYVIPSDTETTFIYDGPSGELIVCNPGSGCY
mgnify:FL=1|jgi:hypothetical protein